MEPAIERWTPLVQTPEGADLIKDYGLPRRRQSFLGSALTLRFPSGSDVGNASELRTFSRVLAIRSRTEVEYRLDPGWSRFRAVAGIDPACSAQGNAILEVYADDRIVWREIIDGDGSPNDVDVDISGARRLRILVDYGRNLDFGDRVHLVDAKVTK